MAAGRHALSAAEGADTDLDRKLHRTIAGVAADIEALSFNKAVAKIYELANAIEKAAPSASRDAATATLVRLVAPMVPHLAEEAWAALGEAGLIADAAWPEVDPALLVDDEVTIAVQVNGKLRDTLVAAKGAAARGRSKRWRSAADKIARLLDGKAAAQGDRRARSPGQHRRMKRVARPARRRGARSPGCGLRPLYAGGGNGVVAQSLAGVEVAPIPERAGWLVRNALVDRLAASGTAAPRYRLEVELDDQITGFGVRTDNAVTRERRTLRARYRLRDAGAAGTVLLDATAGSDAGIDVVSSEYATIAAEQTRARTAVGRHRRSDRRPPRALRVAHAAAKP